MGAEPLLSTIAAGNDAAAALKLAASRGSATLAAAIQAGQFPRTSVYEFGPDDALHAAPAPAKPSRAALVAEKPTKPQPREVPPSVVAAAAAIGRAVTSQPGGPPPVAVTQPLAAAPPMAVAPPLDAGIEGTASAGERASSVWLTSQGVSAESRLAVRLPQSEFTYIDRPWSHFLTRWAAMDAEIQRSVGEAPFSLVDLGSCCGFFSLQAAVAYPKASVFGVEGSVGIGNGTTGLAGTQDQIISTKAVQVHLSWISRLNLGNCFLAPEVWDFKKVCGLAAGGHLCDVMMLLSVVHHIDNVSVEQYAEQSLSREEGSVQLMSALLKLAPRHFVELPDKPWLQHVYDRFGTARAYLEAAAKLTGKKWNFLGPLAVSEWYGRRELWLMEEDTQTAAQPMLSVPGRHEAIFPRVLPSSGVRTIAAEPAKLEAAPPPRAVQPHELSKADIGAGLLKAPTALLAAHLQLRDAMISAEMLLREKANWNDVPER